MGPESQLIVWGSKTNLDPFVQNEELFGHYTSTIYSKEAQQTTMLMMVFSGFSVEVHASMILSSDFGFDSFKGKSWDPL